MTTVFDASSRELHLNSVKFEGGEGRVFDHPSNPQLLIKIYKEPSQKRAAKIEALIRLGAVAENKFHEMTAWPQEHVFGKRDRNRESVGFLMRKVNGVAIHSIYSPKERKVNHPEFTWLNLICLAKNVAAAFHKIHLTGAVMGDVNEGNFLVDPTTGLITLIDCDSYQITYQGQVYRCPVGVGQWTPPELHGVDLDETDRTQNHDLFGLAALIFLLLFLGRHPFASQAEGDLDKAILNHYFSYCETLKARGVLQPPGTLANRDVSPEVFNLFEHAFLAGSNFGDLYETCPGCRQKNRIPRKANSPLCGKCGAQFSPDWKVRRPSAEQWISALTQMESQMSKCSANSLHFRLLDQDCPFCRLDMAGTPVFDSNTERLWNELLQIQIPALSPVPTVALPMGTPLPKGTSKFNPAVAIGWILIIVAVFLGFAVNRAAFGIGILGLIVISKCKNSKAFELLKSQRKSAVSSLQHQVKTLQKNLNNLISERTKTLESLKVEAARYHKLLQEIPEKHKCGRNNLEWQRREHEVKIHLDRFLISQIAAISGLGPGRKAVLQANAIKTAWDVRSHRRRPTGIPNQVWRELQGWSLLKAREFLFDPANPTLVQDFEALSRRMRQEQLQLQIHLGELHAQGRHISLQTQKDRLQLEDQLLATLRSQKQAEADLLVMENA